MNLSHLSTSTPASEISSADFDRNDGYVGDESNVPSLDDILRNSPAAEFLNLPEVDEESLPPEDEDASTTDESSEEEPQEENGDESANDLDDEETEEESEEEGKVEDDASTQETELPAEEDIDWEYKIPVSVDGKVEYKTLEEIRKGYATDQHLSQKGRELGELKKQVEQERTEKLQELVRLGSLLNEQLSSTEASLAQEYHKLTADIDKARDEGDTYTVRELKEQREAVQEKYWKARNGRETQLKAVSEKLIEQQNANQAKLLEQFQKEIPTLIPEFNDKLAVSIREFAIKEGIPESLLDVVYDPRVVKFINDYRKLKTAKETGEMKRKAAPVVKSVPTKKGTPQSQRQKDAEQNNRAKVLSGQGSKADELDFLKRISSVSKKL